MLPSSHFNLFVYLYVCEAFLSDIAVLDILDNHSSVQITGRAALHHSTADTGIKDNLAP